MVPKIVHYPGDALILDWGKLCTVREGARARVLWGLVAVLGFSRYRMARCVWSNDVASTLSAIESLLTEIEGVPLRVTSDNPKCFRRDSS